MQEIVVYILKKHFKIDALKEDVVATKFICARVKSSRMVKKKKTTILDKS